MLVVTMVTFVLTLMAISLLKKKCLQENCYRKNTFHYLALEMFPIYLAFYSRFNL
jgi:hypothetical protein